MSPEYEAAMEVREAIRSLEEEMSGRVHFSQGSKIWIFPVGDLGTFLATVLIVNAAGITVRAGHDEARQFWPWTSVLYTLDAREEE